MPEAKGSLRRPGVHDMGKGKEFDVFLSHNSGNKPVVRRLARRLEKAGLRVWLDERQLRPGVGHEAYDGRDEAYIEAPSASHWCGSYHKTRLRSPAGAGWCTCTNRQGHKIHAPRLDRVFRPESLYPVLGSDSKSAASA